MDIFYSEINKLDLKEINPAKRQTEAGRLILYKTAKNFYKINNTELEIINKKPFFKYSDINFSISHSRDIAAVCFDKYNVGFDIEEIKERDFLTISKRMNFECKENTLEEFYVNWTQYEAKYKLQSEIKSIYSQKFLDKYIISVASNKTTDIKNELKIYKF